MTSEKGIPQVCEWCEGSEVSIEEAYQFDKHKTSHLREEIEGNLINNYQIEWGVLPHRPS
jgi:hypothetical protein